MATATIGGLTLNNPLQLANTAANPNAGSGFAPGAGAGGGGGGGGGGAAVFSPAAAPSTPNAGGAVLAAGGSGGGVAAPAALTAGQLQAQKDFASGNSNATNLINQGITNAAGVYQGSILDYLDQAKQGQNTINQEAIQNELAKRQGSQGVLDMIHNGIQSGGVMLDNMNASTSSAGDAIARAYSLLGRQQQTGIGTQYAEGQSKVANDQSNQNISTAEMVRHAGTDKTTAITNIVNDATQKLTALNTMAMYASIPDRVQIDQQIAQIKQQAMDSLGAYDQTLSSGLSGITPTTTLQNQASAAQLLASGVAPDNAFNFTTAPPPTIQDTGPVASDLPIFTTPKSKTTV